MNVRASEPAMQAICARYLAQIALPAGARVLEVGCGNGASTRLIMQHVGPAHLLALATERACQMFTAEQYRAKAAEFRAFLTNTSRSLNETREFRDLEQTYTTLAENEEWMAVHLDKTVQRRKNSDNRTALAEEEDQILKCLGAAVLMRWNTVPTKLQRELFDCASTIGDLQQTTPLKGQIARFLHNHKNDQQNRVRGEVWF
jgi:hypothetical protein